MRRIGFLVFPGCSLLDFTGPLTAFDVANRAASMLCRPLADRSLTVNGRLRTFAPMPRPVTAPAPATRQDPSR